MYLNNIEITDIIEVFKGLEFNQILREIQCCFNDLFDRIAPSIKYLFSTNLSVLDLSDNSLGDETAIELSKWLRRCDCSLITLILNCNTIGDNGLAKLCDSIINNHCLNHFGIGNNNLTTKSSMPICKLIKFSKNITYLDISWNNFDKHVMFDIICCIFFLYLALYENSTINFIRITGNEFSKNIIDSCEDLSRLRRRSHSNIDIEYTPKK